jgi:hypothetical protein
MLSVGSPDDDLLHFVLYSWNLSFTLPYRTQDSVIGCFSVLGEFCEGTYLFGLDN